MRRTRHDHRNALSRLDLFADCSKAELDAIAHLLTLVDVPAGRVLIREGGRGDQILVLAEGQARVTRGDDQVALLGQGDVVGEMALLSGGRRSATVTAVTDLTLYVGTPAEFRQILLEAPSVAAKVRAAAERRSAPLTVAA